VSGPASLPVAALTNVSLIPRSQARPLIAVDAAVIARLVRTRLQIERGRPWATLASIGAAVLLVGACFSVVTSPSILRVLAVTVPTVLAGTTLLVDRVTRELFLHLARAEGLTDEGARVIEEAAIGADHWIGVLESCGRPPTDREIAAFVLQR
jgi:hypothetical protein